MNYKRWFLRISIGFILILLCVVPVKIVFGQDDVLNLDIELSPVLENSELLNVMEMSLTNPGSGPVLFYCFLENVSDEQLHNLFLENVSDEQLHNLFFEFKVTGSKSGVIIKLNQNHSQPFSIESRQTIYATSSDLANNSVPGIEERIDFTGGLTSEGEHLFNSLGGSTILPPDIYTIQLMVYQLTNFSGRRDLASSSKIIGSSASFNDSGIYLKAPGDVAGTEIEIVNPYPQFSWEGEANTNYRLIVVNANGQDSPESLLQSAKSSEPTELGGSLLQFENLDRIVTGANFQFPASGVQALQKGETYYWQVIRTMQLSSGTEDRVSEIWSFKLADNGAVVSEIPEAESVGEALILLLGQQRYERFKADGYQLSGLEIDDKAYTGPEAVQQLEEILQKIKDEEIFIQN